MAEQLKQIEVNAVTHNQRKCYYCGFEYPHQAGRACPAKNATCVSCGIKGHFAKVCRKDKEKSTRPKENETPAQQSSTRHAAKTDKPYRTKDKQRARAIQHESDNESDGSSSDGYLYTVQEETHSSKLKTTLRIGDKDIMFLVDTGATVDIIDSSTYDKIKDGVSLRKSTTKIYAYGSTAPLPIKGRFQATIESKKRYTVSQFYVVDGMGGNLVSAKTAQDLSLIKLINTISGIPVNDDQQTPASTDTLAPESETPTTTHEIPVVKDARIQDIINRHKTVFEGEGKLNNQKVKLHIRDDVQPVVQPQRRIPYHMRKKVSTELTKLVNLDIIEPVQDQPTPWISPIVCTPKKDGCIRLCVDMREANQAIERERHVMPTLQDFKAEVNGSKYFSKLDLKQAYHQLELESESRFITTFSTHDGLFRYKRLNYGTSSAAEIFQNVLEQNLRDIRGVKNIADDIIIHGKNTERS